jgi:hypothetical protein
VEDGSCVLESSTVLQREVGHRPDMVRIFLILINKLLVSVVWVTSKPILGAVPGGPMIPKRWSFSTPGKDNKEIVGSKRVLREIRRKIDVYRRGFWPSKL